MQPINNLYLGKLVRLAALDPETELNLHRVTLDAFEYNPRALRSYQKAGFVEEGRLRGALHRDGRRRDMIFMGILRQEWQEGRTQ